MQAEWFSDTTWTQDAGSFDISLPVYIGIGCILAVWPSTSTACGRRSGSAT